MSIKVYLLREAMHATCAAARAKITQPTVLNDEVWNEAFGEKSFDIEDGKARIWALNKFNILHVFKRVRLGDPSLQVLAKEVRFFKEMTKPQGRNKRALKRNTFFREVIVAIPERDKATGQLIIRFPFKSFTPSIEWKFRFEDKILSGDKSHRRPIKETGKLHTSYYFLPEFIKAPGLEGWAVPYKQKQGQPWKILDNKVQGVPPRTRFVPILTNEEIQMLLKGNTSQVVRNLHERHWDDLQNRKLFIMDIKEGVDRLLDTLEPKA